MGRALAAEARVAKEVERLKADQGVEDLEDLKPDRDIEEVIAATTHAATQDVAAARQDSAEGSVPEAPAEEEKRVQMARALRLAAASANFGEVIELQAAGADVNAAEPGSGMAALHLACFFGALDVARSLIAGGADKSAIDKYGRSCRGILPEGSALVELFE